MNEEFGSEGFVADLRNNRTLIINGEYYSVRSAEGQLIDAVRLKNIIQCEVSSTKHYALVIGENNHMPAEQWETLAGEKCESCGGTHYLYFDNADDLLRTYYFIRRHT